LLGNHLTGCLDAGFFQVQFVNGFDHMAFDLG
jgi:hypothetical protein